MKFLHVADVHLDSEPTSLSAFEFQEPLSIASETRSAFKKCIDLAIKERVDFVLIAGDLFDKNWKDYRVGLFFIHQVNRLDCPVIYIRGNHDAVNRLVKRLPLPKHVHMLRHKLSETILLKDLKVAVHGQSYASYHLEEDLAANYPSAVKGYFNVGLLHTSGPKTSENDPYAPYHIETLKNKGYQYWALGHLHDAQIISRSPWTVYSGIIQGRSVKECGQKGAYIVEVSGSYEVTPVFYRLADVCWEFIEIDISEVQSEQALRDLVVKEVVRSVEESTDRNVIRLCFLGVRQVEFEFISKSDFWRNTIYCWLEEDVPKNLYLEKVIDNTQKAKQHQEDEEVAFGSFNDQEIKSLLKDEIDLLESQLPKEALCEGFLSDFKSRSLKGGLTSGVQGYLKGKLTGGDL